MVAAMFVWIPHGAERKFIDETVELLQSCSLPPANSTNRGANAPEPSPLVPPKNHGELLPPLLKPKAKNKIASAELKHY